MTGGNVMLAMILKMTGVKYLMDVMVLSVVLLEKKTKFGSISAIQNMGILDK